MTSVRSDSPSAPKTTPAPDARPFLVAIEASNTGFIPNAVTVPKGRTVKFEFHRTSRNRCFSIVTIHLSQRLKISQPLVFGTTMEFSLILDRSGKILYTCERNEFEGSVTIQ